MDEQPHNMIMNYGFTVRSTCDEHFCWLWSVEGSYCEPVKIDLQNTFVNDIVDDNLLRDGACCGYLDGITSQRDKELIEKRNQRKEAELNRKLLQEQVALDYLLVPTPAPTDLNKWDHKRINSRTKFVSGSDAHRALGLNPKQGEIYAKHSEVPRYPVVDRRDKAYLAKINLKTAIYNNSYILLRDDVKKLGLSPEYKPQSKVLLLELTSFKLQRWFLKKIERYIMKKKLSFTSNLTTEMSATSHATSQIVNFDDTTISLGLDSKNNSSDGYTLNETIGRDLDVDLNKHPFDIEPLDNNMDTFSLPT